MAFGGPLKLKGGAGVGKKKKAKKTKTNTKTMSNETDAFEQADVVEDGRAEDRGGGGGKGVGPALVDRRTASERRFDAVQAKREKEAIEKLASKTHKDKVQEFNEKLAKLSEHHDIPKVGPG